MIRLAQAGGFLSGHLILKISGLQPWLGRKTMG
jgi:hypothetical protein